VIHQRHCNNTKEVVRVIDRVGRWGTAFIAAQADTSRHIVTYQYMLAEGIVHGREEGEQILQHLQPLVNER